MHRLRNVLRHWLQSAVVIVAMCALIFVVTQQTLRWYANDPQIQMAGDGAKALEKGAAPETLATQGTIDVEQSLAPFIMVIDDTGRVIFSSGQANGKPPTLPLGVLEYTRKQGEDRITWTLIDGMRIATVVKRYEGTTAGFILVGRSLREVEDRINTISDIVTITLVLTLVASFAASYLAESTLRHTHHRRSGHTEEEEDI